MGFLCRNLLELHPCISFIFHLHANQYNYKIVILTEGLEVGIVHGLEKAIGKMNKEEKSMITIKPGKHGFGPEGNPELGIPPGATIEYEVEIKDFVKVCLSEYM